MNYIKDEKRTSRGEAHLNTSIRGGRFVAL